MAAMAVRLAWEWFPSYRMQCFVVEIGDLGEW